MVTKRQIEKTTVYLLFSLFIQFSAIEIGWFFSHAKLMISCLQWLEKRWGARARWWAIAIFRLTELNIKANPPCFQCARARGRAKWRHKLCAERMRNANVRNHLKPIVVAHKFFPLLHHVLTKRKPGFTNVQRSRSSHMSSDCAWIWLLARWLKDVDILAKSKTDTLSVWHLVFFWPKGELLETCYAWRKILRRTIRYKCVQRFIAIMFKLIK